MKQIRDNKLYRTGHWLHVRGWPRLARVCDLLNYVLRNSGIPAACRIGAGTSFGHGGGIGLLIHRDVVIGSRCVLGPHVAIGGNSGSERVAVIEDGVFLGAGSKVLGDLRVGHHAIVGANSVVLRDVPPFHVVAGVPAKQVAVVNRENYWAKYRHYYLDESEALCRLENSQ